MVSSSGVSEQTYPNSRTDNDKIDTLRSWIKSSRPGRMVFLGGAGVSTESGIPDFRSPKGLYGRPYDYPYPPETMISHSFFESHPREFFKFYCERMLFLDAKPNQAHKKLAELERDGILRSVITQNIDGLHQAAGSEKVWELHGSVWRNYCLDDHEYFSVEDLLVAHERAEDGVPRCSKGAIIKPDVVLYEEPLDQEILYGAIEDIRQSDLMIIAGTSLSVYPAAGLLDYFNGDHLVIVNKSTTPQDAKADLCINESVGSVFDF